MWRMPIYGETLYQNERVGSLIHMAIGISIWYTKSVILIDCVAKDDDKCLADTTYFTGSWANCTKAKESCSDWSKDLYRCCPQTCGTDRLDDSQCHALEGKGKCIYPVKNQCLEPRKYLLTI